VWEIASLVVPVQRIPSRQDEQDVGKAVHKRVEVRFGCPPSVEGEALRGVDEDHDERTRRHVGKFVG